MASSGLNQPTDTAATLASSHMTCTVCLEPKPSHEAKHTVDDDLICDECVADYLIPLFHNALHSETEYPPRWASIKIDANQFKTELGDQFMRRYQRMESEYTTLPYDRVYCKHQILEASKPLRGCTPPQKLALTDEQATQNKAQGVSVSICSAMVASRSRTDGQWNLICYSCKGSVCGACKEPLSRTEDDAAHECKPTPFFLSEADDRFKDMTRGRDYQLCPNPACGTAIELSEACNHLVCTICQTGFCFICGEEADHDGDHFKAGKKCPRFGQPDSDRAIYDGAVPDAIAYLIVHREAMRRDLDLHHAQPVLARPGNGVRWAQLTEQDKWNAQRAMLDVGEEILAHYRDWTPELAEQVASILDLLEEQLKMIYTYYEVRPEAIAAHEEAPDDGMTLDFFLAEWCLEYGQECTALDGWLKEELEQVRMPEGLPLLTRALAFVREHSRPFRVEVIGDHLRYKKRDSDEKARKAGGRSV